MTIAPAARFGVVGSGWRTQFFLRLARLAPADLTVTGVVSRTAQRGAQIEAEWDVPTFRTLADLAATQLYSVHKLLESDLDGTLGRLADIGLRYVEAFGFVRRSDAL